MTVRHRGSGTPPNAAPPAAKSDPPGAVDNGAVGGGGPVRPRRRRDLGSKKQLSVLGGSLVVLVLCLLGMRSASVDDGRAARKATPKNERHKLPSRHKEQMRDKIKKREKLQRPRGIGRRKDEDFFPIPKSPKRYDDADVPRKEHQSQRDEDPPEPVPREPPRREKRHDQKRMKDAELRGKDRKRHKVKRTDEDRANDEEESSEFAVGERTIRRNGAQGGHPRVLGLHLEAIPGAQRASADEDDEEEEYPKFSVALSKVHLLPVHESRTLPSSDRFVSPYPDDEDYWERQETIKKSKKYRGGHREPLEDKQCKPRHEWQAGAFPNCNVIHEYELGQLTGVFGRALRKKLVRKEGEGDEMVKYLAHGYWRDVWMVSKTGPFESRARDPESEFEEEITALKTLRYRHDFTDRNYDRHRKDALASERLSGSPNVIDIYAYCSNTAVYEYGAGGDIEGKLWAFDEKEDNYYTVDMTGAEKLDIAYQVARGIADMHDVEDDGHASIAHSEFNGWNHFPFGYHSYVGYIRSLHSGYNTVAVHFHQWTMENE
ncbi:hypothetical protein ACHAWF_015661 [Thalassiosira exigua]